MKKNKVNIYFDESGKLNENGPSLMGGILIPQNIYNLQEIKNLNIKLKNKEIKLHFTSYNGNYKTKKDYLDVIKVFSKYLKFCNANVLSYKSPQGDYLDYTTVKNMIYTKFPERVFYGLLRNLGDRLYIDAEIFMEEESNYSKMIKTLPMTLNTQSLYRAEKFKIINSKLVSKNTEIGVEFTDIFLGMIRHIILSINDDNTVTSKTKKEKNLLILECLQIPDFYNFMISLNYFEWGNSSCLKEVKFESYINFFIAKQLLSNQNT